MIAEIGLLFSFYVFVRMVDMVMRHSHRSGAERGLLLLLAIATSILAAFVGFDMMLRLAEGATQVPAVP